MLHHPGEAKWVHYFNTIMSSSAVVEIKALTTKYLYSAQNGLGKV